MDRLSRGVTRGATAGSFSAIFIPAPFSHTLGASLGVITAMLSHRKLRAPRRQFVDNNELYFILQKEGAEFESITGDCKNANHLPGLRRRPYPSNRAKIASEVGGGVQPDFWCHGIQVRERAHVLDCRTSQ